MSSSADPLVVGFSSFGGGLLSDPLAAGDALFGEGGAGVGVFCRPFRASFIAVESVLGAGGGDEIGEVETLVADFSGTAGTASDVFSTNGTVGLVPFGTS